MSKRPSDHSEKLPPGERPSQGTAQPSTVGPSLLERAAALIEEEQGAIQPAQRPVQPPPRPPLEPKQGASVPAQRVKPPMARSAPASTNRSARTPAAETSTDSRAEPSDQQVRDQFHLRFRRQMLLVAIMLPAFVVARLDSRHIHSSREIGALAVFFVGFILTLINWRCPRCSRYLYRRIYPSTCPRCGVTFHD